MSTEPRVLQARELGEAISVAAHDFALYGVTFVQPLDAAHEALEAYAASMDAEIARLTAELEEARKDAGRLDYMLKESAFVVWSLRDGTIRQCQVWTQDEDEAYHYPAGEHRFFNTERDAIDAAMTKEATHGRPE